MGKLVTANTFEEALKPQYTKWGTEHFIITKEQLQDLIDGKYLVDSDPEEYGTIISLEQ